MQRDLRRDIYRRDKGICWVCNTFVDYDIDYDLGHLIERCNGGEFAADNLTVMHHKCNLSKPRHNTIEEAVKWQLNNRFLISSNLFNQYEPIINNVPELPIKPVYKPNIPISTMTSSINKVISTDNSVIVPLQRHLNSNHRTRHNTRNEDLEAMKQLVIEHLRKNSHLLLAPDIKYQIIDELSKTFNIDKRFIRRWIIESGLGTPTLNKNSNDKQYFYISEHLQELVNKYYNLRCPLWDKPKLLGITRYGMSIMFYLAGIKEHNSPKDLLSIIPKIATLNIPLHPELSRS